MSAELRDEIAQVLNRHSRENRSDTPDFLLAEFVLDSLDAWDRVVRMRETWYGRGDGGGIPAPIAPEEALLAPDLGEPLHRQEYPGAPSRDDELAEKRDRLQQREEPGEYTDVEQDRESTVDFGWDRNTSLGTAFGEAVGAASMCWSETPTGVFDSDRASDIVNELLRFITIVDYSLDLARSKRPLGIVEDPEPQPTGEPDEDRG